MTKAPERIWAAECRATNSTMWWPDDAGGVGTQYIRADHVLALVSAALEPWVDLRDESRGVTGFHLNGNEATWDEFDLPELAADEQAALERVKQEARNEARNEAAKRVFELQLMKTSKAYEDGYSDGVGDCRNVILVLMEDQSDG